MATRRQPTRRTGRRGKARAQAVAALILMAVVAGTVAVLLARSQPSPVLVLSSPYVARIQIGEPNCLSSDRTCPVAAAWPTVRDITTNGYIVGDTLATTAGSWFEPTGRRAHTRSYRYQWQRCRVYASTCLDIPGADHPTYSLTATDVGAAIRAVVTARSSAGSAVQASALTTPIGGRIHNFGCSFGMTTAEQLPGGAPAATGVRLMRAAPSTSGLLTALSMHLTPAATAGGEPLRGVIYADASGSPGALLGVTGPLVLSRAATAGWYTLELPASLHLTTSVPYWIGVRTGAGPAPSPAPSGSGSRSSSPVPVCGIDAPAGSPASTLAPAIADTTTPGAWAAGDQLTASAGAWGPAAVAYGYQWQHCDSAGLDCTDIPGATANTYLLTPNELGGTVRVVVRASNRSGSGSASSVLSGSGPRTVSRTPNGPATPGGGWSVAYADAFGAPLGTGPGQDNTVWPSRVIGHCTNNPAFNPNEMEVFNCSQASIDPTGLKLTCDYAPHIGPGANYNCGAVNTGGKNSSVAAPGHRLFRFMPGHGPEWAIQIIARFPPNTGEADPGWWLTDPRWTWELDMFEGFGPSAGAGGTWCNPTAGSTWVGTTDPTWIFDTETRANIAGQQMLCRDAQPTPFDPSAGYHTYTTVIYPNGTLSEYIDGHLQVWDSVPHGGSAYVHDGTTIGPPPTLPTTYGGLIISYGLRDTVTGNPDPYFTSGARSLSVRSIAVYENASAKGADALNPGLIAPGTTVSP